MGATLRRCAFLSTDDLDGFVVYDQLAIPPLERRGWSVDTVSWRSRDVDWSAYEVVVIRSPWDYQSEPNAFLDVLAAIDRSPARLENALAVVRWNLAKTYLRQLEERGVRVVPTRWFDDWDGRSVAAAFDAFENDEIILKPTIGANADDTFRVRRDALARRTPELAARFRRRPHMAQPFVESVLRDGEISLFYFGGAYSHAVRKVPRAGDFRVQEEHGGRIHPYHADAALQAAAKAAIAGVGEPLLYARADFVAHDGGFALMELELVEPSLYFDMDACAPERFAAALDRLPG